MILEQKSRLCEKKELAILLGKRAREEARQASMNQDEQHTQHKLKCTLRIVTLVLIKWAKKHGLISDFLAAYTLHDVRLICKCLKEKETRQQRQQQDCTSYLGKTLIKDS